MPYNEFGEPIDHWPTPEEIAAQNNKVSFWLGFVVGFIGSLFLFVVL